MAASDVALALAENSAAAFEIASALACASACSAASVVNCNPVSAAVVSAPVPVVAVVNAPVPVPAVVVAAPVPAVDNAPVPEVVAAPPPTVDSAPVLVAAAAVFFAAIAALTSLKFKPASAMTAPTSACVALGLAASQTLMLSLTSSTEMLFSCAYCIPALVRFKFELASPIVANVCAPASLTTDCPVDASTNELILPEPSVDAMPALPSSSLSVVFVSAITF